MWMQVKLADMCGVRGVLDEMWLARQGAGSKGIEKDRHLGRL